MFAQNDVWWGVQKKMKINSNKAMAFWAVFFLAFGLTVIPILPNEAFPWIVIEIIVIYVIGLIIILRLKE